MNVFGDDFEATVTGIEELNEKWLAFGWDVIVADGHDFESILDAFPIARKQNGKPKMILFKTEMGHGVDFMAGKHTWHGKAPSEEQCAEALKQLKETFRIHDRYTENRQISDIQ